MRLEAMTCEIVLHYDCFFIRAVNIWELGKSKLRFVPHTELLQWGQNVIMSPCASVMKNLGIYDK